RRLRENPQPQELTLRAALTGMLIGALLTPCNIYSGLKIGWSFNMSIAAAILGVGFWRQYERFFKPKSQWSILESNISQTSASAAASIVSSGFAAPIPALALLTNQYLSYVELVIWTCAVSFVGVCVALLLRHQFI